MITEPRFSFIIIRLLVGGVFLSEGIQKFLYPDLRGVGRFRDSIGMPAPEFLGYWVASWEVVCGALLIVGLFTRLAAIPTLGIMVVALATTKFVMLGDATLVDGLPARAEGMYDDSVAFRFWYMAHAMRTDTAMFLGSIFIIINGAGRASIDASLAPKPQTTSNAQAASPARETADV